MNKKEVSELRRIFSPESDLFVMNHVLTVIVNPNSESEKIRYKNVSSGITMNEYETSIYFETLKKILSTKVGKKIIEYKFPNSAYDYGEPQNILYDISQSGFINECDTETFIYQIVDNIDNSVPYSIIAAHCTYTVFRKNKADETEKESSEEYKFILTAICPIKNEDKTFAYNFVKDEFISNKDSNLLIDKNPTDGFLFPAFNDRSSDINSVMYYTNKPKNSNISIIENVLGCSAKFSPETEFEFYKALLNTIVGDELSYDIITAMNNELQMFIDEYGESTELPMVYKRDLYNMLNKVLEYLNIDKNKLEVFDAVYNKLIGEKIPLTAPNLVDSKFLVDVYGVSLNIKNPSVCHIESDSYKTRIVIDIAEPNFEINGMSINK